MALYRCESAQDMKSGKYFVEVYYPDNVDEPMAVTLPIFNSQEEAEQSTLVWFKKFVEDVNKLG